MLEPVPLPTPGPAAAMQRAPRWLLLVAAVFFAVTTADSWFRWATFQYETFDLAFYVQSVWLLLRGQWHVSLLNVPMLGNHADPIVFLAAPLFALWPHPMLFVLLQNAALATMPFVAWRIARRLDLPPRAAGLMAAATLVAPAAGFAALHEFHPETLSAPFLLYLIAARMAGQLGRFWLWVVATAACKENVALLLVGFAAVQVVVEWRRGWGWNWRWNVAPLLTTAGWVALYGLVLGPLWNSGNVDFTGLYSHLGDGAGGIVGGLVHSPGRWLGALAKSLSQGNLLPGLLLPFAGLPLLRPRWLLIAAPILVQHLLSWRRSEWMLYFHYGAPLLPLFWMAAVESLQGARKPERAALLVVSAALLAQAWLGPVWPMIETVRHAPAALHAASWKRALLANVPAGAGVTAGMPFLSHLATRETLYSLHHVLKGLRTLSRERFEPGTPADVVVVDYSDRTTFDTFAGYYHPAMRTVDGRQIPSSDRLLHEYLQPAGEPPRAWASVSCNSMAVLRQTSAIDADPPAPLAADRTLAGLQLVPGTRLEWFRPPVAAVPARLPHDFTIPAAFLFQWHCEGNRERFPWMSLLLEGEGKQYPIVKGLCAPGTSGDALEVWQIIAPAYVAPGDYRARLLFYDNAEAAWHGTPGVVAPEHVLGLIDAGTIRVRGEGQCAR